MGRSPTPAASRTAAPPDCAPTCPETRWPRLSLAVSPDDGSLYATGFYAATVVHLFRKTAPDTRIASGPARARPSPSRARCSRSPPTRTARRSSAPSTASSSRRASPRPRSAHCRAATTGWPCAPSPAATLTAPRRPAPSGSTRARPSRQRPRHPAGDDPTRHPADDHHARHHGCDDRAPGPDRVRAQGDDPHVPGQREGAFHADGRPARREAALQARLPPVCAVPLTARLRRA